MLLTGACPITFANESLLLLPDRAIFWPARRTLLLADVHLGKSASFRTLGLPVPEGSTAKDLSRITHLIEQTRANRIIILGDLIHAKSGRQPEVVNAISAWRDSHPEIQMILVRGNHDRASGRIPAEWNIEEVEEPFTQDGFVFAHDEVDCAVNGEADGEVNDAKLPTFAGHIHPTIQLTDYDGSTVTVPCFVFDDHIAILPAFGTFTGGYKVIPRPTRRLFMVAPGRVVALSTDRVSPV